MELVDVEQKGIHQIIVDKGIYSTDGPTLKNGILEVPQQKYSDTVYATEDTKNSWLFKISVTCLPKYYIGKGVLIVLIMSYTKQSSEICS